MEGIKEDIHVWKKNIQMELYMHSYDISIFDIKENRDLRCEENYRAWSRKYEIEREDIDVVR